MTQEAMENALYLIGLEYKFGKSSPKSASYDAKHGFFINARHSSEHMFRGSFYGVSHAECFESVVRAYRDRVDEYRAVCESYDAAVDKAGGIRALMGLRP